MYRSASSPNIRSLVIANRNEIEKCTHRAEILTVTILLIKRYSGDEQNWSVLESAKSEMRSRYGSLLLLPIPI